MTVTINGKDYEARNSVYDDVEKVWFDLPITLEDAVSFGDTPEITLFGKTIEVDSIRSIERTESAVRVAWYLPSLEHRLERQLEETKAALNVSTEKISRVKDAIAALGEGIPTLSKLREFLTAVKEAIKDATDD